MAIVAKASVPASMSLARDCFQTCQTQNHGAFYQTLQLSTSTRFQKKQQQQAIGCVSDVSVSRLVIPFIDSWHNNFDCDGKHF